MNTPRVGDVEQPARQGYLKMQPDHDPTSRHTERRRAKMQEWHQWRKQWRAQHGDEPIRVEAWRLRRRIEALQALGWSRAVIARHAGITQQSLNETLLSSTWIPRGRFNTLDRVYDDLSMRIPATDTASARMSVAKTLAFARRNGYVPPLAWDDIDDAAEVPCVGSESRRSRAELVEEFEWLTQGGVSRHEALTRLGVGWDAVEKAYADAARGLCTAS